MRGRRFCAHKGASRTTKYLLVHPGPANTTANIELAWFGGQAVAEEVYTGPVGTQAPIPRAPRSPRPAGGHALRQAQVATRNRKSVRLFREPAARGIFAGTPVR